MATHSSVLAWRIPGTGEPGGLLSMGSHRVGHDWSDLAAAAAAVTIVTWLEWLMLLPVAVSYMDLHIGYWKQLTVDWNNWYLHNPGMEKLFENCYDWLETQAYRNSKDKEKKKKKKGEFCRCWGSRKGRERGCRHIKGYDSIWTGWRMRPTRQRHLFKVNGDGVMEWTASLFNTYTEVITSNMTVFGDRAFKEIIKVKWYSWQLKMEKLYTVSKDLELTMVQIMSSLLPNSDLNWRK